MKKFILLITVLLFFLTNCSKYTYATNGETIYRTGKNKQAQLLLDKNKSQITFIRSCQGCHGKTGDRNSNCNIKYSHLSDAQKTKVPYTDPLFFRFLNDDVKSDGSIANTGVHFRLSTEDQQDLLLFLKSL